VAESQTGSNNIPSDKKYPKLSKAASGYLELEQFKNAVYIQDIFAMIVRILSKILIVQ
jgi:hypothetical protein